MRAAAALLALGWYSVAGADEPALAPAGPLTIGALDLGEGGNAGGAPPALSACLAGPAIVAEVRRSLPSLEVAAAPAAGGTTVALRARAGQLDVELRRRGADGIERAEHHPVPLGDDCAALRETVASIVTRALVPVGWQPIAPVRRAVLPPVVVQVPSPRAPPPSPLPPPAVAAGEGTPTPPASAVPPPAPLLASPPPRPPPYLQIAAAARLNLSPEGVSAGAGGLFTVGLRLRHLVLFAGAGIEQAVRYDSDTAHIQMQRVPVVAGLAYELDLPGGAVRLGAGGLFEVWSVTTADPTGRTAARWEHGGVYATLTYHYRPVRLLDVFGGLDFEQSFAPHRFAAGDRSLVGTSPSQWWSPTLGLALNLF